MGKIRDLLKSNLSVFKATASGEQGKRYLPTGYETQGYSFENLPSAKKAEYLREVKGWAGGCICAIADEVATIEIKLYKYTSKDGVEEVTDHEVLNVLYRVNDYTTKFDHFWLTSAYLKTTGESPWLIEREGNTVKNIFFLKPDRLIPIIGEDRLISGYNYDMGNGSKVNIPKEMVIFLKVPDPANPFRGLGTMQMAARTIDLDNYSEDWNKTFYENAAHPDSVLKVKVDNLDEDQLGKLKESIKDEYQGIQKAHQVMVLFGDMDWQKMGFSQKDMDFLEQQKFSRDKIFGLFRVPKAIMAQTEGVNFASAKAAQYVFARWTIRPEMERIIQQLNEFFLPMFKGTENMFLSYENPVQEDEESKSKIYQMGIQTGWLTINEVREMEGFPDVEGGDSIYLPLNIAPIGSTPEPTEPQKGANYIKLDVKRTKGEKERKAKKVYMYTERLREMKAKNQIYFDLEKVKDKIDEMGPKIREMLKKEIRESRKHLEIVKKEIDPTDIERTRVITDEEKMAFWETKIAIGNRHIPKIKSIMDDIFELQRKKTLRKIKKFKAFKLDPTTVYEGIKLDENAELKVAMTLMLPEIEDLFKEAGEEAFKLLGLDIEMDITRDKIKKLLRSEVRKFSKSATDTTNEGIKKTVIDGLSSGRSVNEISDDLSKYFHTEETYRSERIARTETVRYNTAASEQAFIDSELVEEKEWFVNPDACEYCKPMAGKRLKLGEKYFEIGDTVNGENGESFVVSYEEVKRPPLHVNCACELIPVFKKKEIKKEETKKVKKKIIKK